ncbi:MAG: Peptide deformylase related protein [Cytophagales bacterium]|jgi:peptide deformylase|nr:peptide deformylase [Bacteroidota bacterium]MBS1982070.1 peptide deformylase [Bacteroidota bacterium]WHZ06459.1 MAG: Peptide deformylase related protein [Cytophagales bacterium]
MKGLADLLLLGNPLLYEVSKPIEQQELPDVKTWVSDLHHTMEEIRAQYHFGRGIAAPQLGIMKRLIYINIDKPMIMINPELTYLSPELVDVWDDCMCFPHLLVKVKRHCSLILKYKDETWSDQVLNAENDWSELIQHEYDHLNGVLCTMRAIDEKSFRWRK